MSVFFAQAVAQALVSVFVTLALSGAAIGIVVGCVSWAVLGNGWRAILRSVTIAAPVFVLSVLAIYVLGPQTTLPVTITKSDGTMSTAMSTGFHGEPRHLAGLFSMGLSLSVEAWVQRARRRSATVR